jgi:DNA-binding transcriptional regulator YdaS (Cro superfamily)
LYNLNMDDESIMVVALRDAVTEAGSQEAFAGILGITQQAVSKMIRLGRPLPERHVELVELKTGISRHRLRPDIHPVDPSSPSLGDGSVAGGAPVVLSDRGAEIDRSTPTPRGDA